MKTSGELTQTPKLQTQGGNPSPVPTKLSVVLSRLKHLGSSKLVRPALLASLSITGLLFVGRQLGLLEPLELSAYDQLMQVRPALPPDPRLLIVKVTEADIQSYPPYPLTDAVMAQLLSKLEQYQPAGIGVDIYRDIPQPPGHAELSTLLKKSDLIIPVCNVGRDADTPGTPPPPSVPTSRAGFADFSLDDNGIIRRGLLFLTPPDNSRCMSDQSLSFQLARRYLEKKGIKADLVEQKHFQLGKGFKPEWVTKEYLKLGNVIFKPVLPSDGGYQHGDTGGYQIFLNYRSANSLARSVTLSDVLNNRIDSSWVKDRIVLIGVTASSIDDAFFTPYSSGQRRNQKMPGVVVHGQIVSQLLSTVLDGRPQFWFLPDWAEVLWIWGWALAGGIVVRLVRHPGQLVLAEGVTLSSLLGISVVAFLGSGWIPVVAPTLGLITAAFGVIGYSVYEAKQEAEYIADKVKQQEQNIALLQTLLKEKIPSPLTTEPYGELDEETAIPPDDDEDSTSVWTPGEVSSDSIRREDKKDANLLAGRYKINRTLSSGGFGVTFLAQDTHRPGAPQCVVKQLKPARRDEKFLQIARRLFDTEAQILEKLGTHPQIPRLLAHFEERKEFYLVQEFVDGHPLTDELPVDKKLPDAQVVQLLKDVLEVLSFIHEHGVIHRDIKPGNIMRRDHDGQVILIDFGAVKQIQPQEQADQENFTVAIGTRGYAPPEQYAGHPTISSDIYALGMIGIQALTGIPPYRLELSPETGDVSWHHLANVREEIAKIIDQMVRYNFPARYQSAVAVLEDLRRI